VGSTYVDLTDDIWKNGGSEYAIETVIRNGVFGQMPAFKQLSDKQVQELSKYVLSLHAGTASP
jgi:mono/diheme cytochrome c family protein